MIDFVLASGSPRRAELLAQIGLKPAEILPADIDETPLTKERPRDYVLRMAREKALAITHELPVLAADTTVICGRNILGKAADREEARTMLQRLSGRRHQVFSAIALSQNTKLRTRMVETKLRFRRLTPQEIETYLDSEEWRDKAGGYAIQGRAAAFIPWISGSYSNVVGLPLAETSILLSQTHA